MAEINWGMLQTPDFAGNALRYRQLGEEEGRQTATRNALKGYSANPDGAIQDLMGVDPEMAMSLQDRQRQDQEFQRGQQERETRKSALAGYGTDPNAARQAAMSSGDPELINQIAQMDEDQRKIAADNAEGVAAFAYSLTRMTPQARRAQLQNPQNVEFLTSKGLTAEQIAGFDPTDEGLAGIIAQGTSLKEMLAAQREDRTAAAEQRRLDLMEEYNQGRLAIGETNAGANVTRANKPPAARGGAGAATSPVLQALAAEIARRKAARGGQ